jgi:O-antigen/teichoic acid export membrane protein
VSSKFKLILKGSGFRVLQTFVSIVIGLLMMPFLITTLGQELYGLWIVIGSIVGSYYLLDLGFNQAVTRYVAKYIHQNNPEGANRIINTSLVIYSLLGVVVLVATILAAHFGAAALMENAKNLTLAQTILIITGLSLAIEFPAKAFPGIISAYMRFDFVAQVRLSKSIIDALLIYYFISHGYGLVAMAMVAFVTGIISTGIYVNFSNKLFKELRYSRQSIDLSTFKDVFHFSKWVFVIDLAALLRDKMDIWFIAFYISNSALTVYYVAVRLVEYALQFLSQATNITGPIFTEYYAKREQQKLQESVLMFIKLDIALGVIFLSGFYVLGIGFINLWMKGSVPAEEAFSCLMILAVGRFAAYFVSPLNSLLLTINKHSIGSYISVGETIASAILCWVLIPKFGLNGAAYAIAIPNLIARLIVLPICCGKYINLELKGFLLRVVLSLSLSIAFSCFAKNLISNPSGLTLVDMLLFAALIAVVQVGVGALLFTRQELLVVKKLMPFKKA